MKRVLVILLAACTACGSVKSTEDGSDAGDDPPTDSTADSSTDPATDTSTDSATDTSWEPACGVQTITWAVDDMDLTGTMEIDIAEGPEGDLEYLHSTGPAGTASYDVDVPCTDTWVLWGYVWWETGGEDSYYYDWDGGDRWVWDLMQQCGSSIDHEWYWDQLSRREETGSCGPPDEDPHLLDLDEGTHTFTLEAREEYSRVAEFVLTNDPTYVP